MISMIRSFSELRNLETFKERYDYLKLKGYVGESTFGYDRFLNQILYRSQRWRQVRNEVIVRDNGCDLGILEFEILDQVIIHHMNPITIQDIKSRDEKVFDPEFLICTSPRTHRAIHFGDESLLPRGPIIRLPNDTIPWR